MTEGSKDLPVRVEKGDGRTNHSPDLSIHDPKAAEAVKKGGPRKKGSPH